MASAAVLQCKVGMQERIGDLLTVIAFPESLQYRWDCPILYLHLTTISLKEREIYRESADVKKVALGMDLVEFQIEHACPRLCAIP